MLIPLVHEMVAKNLSSVLTEPTSQPNAIGVAADNGPEPWEAKNVASGFLLSTATKTNVSMKKGENSTE